MDDKSRALFDKACQLIPGGVNSPVRACHNVDSLPLFIAEAHGSHIIDVDGREYIDFILSWGPMILGHDHPAVTAAVREAAAQGADLCVTPELALCGVAPGSYLRAEDFAEGCKAGLQMLADALQDGPPPK